MQLPKNKMDIASANRLLEVSPQVLEPHIPSLLEWLQDCNWPVAKPVAKALANCGISLVEPIRQILKGDDDIWKYWIAHFLLRVDSEVRIALSEEINRIIKQPTHGEKKEYVVEVMNNVFILLTYTDEPR